MNKKEKILTILFCVTIATFILSDNIKSLAIIEKIKLKHILLILDTFILGTIFVKKYKETKNRLELKNVLYGALALFCISIFFQIYNFSFKTFLIKEMYYIVTPVIFAWIVNNCLSKKNIDLFFNVFFYTIVFAFIVISYEKISLNSIIKAIKNISFMGQNSEFESILADLFALLLLFFLDKKDKTKIILCAILGILSAKRQSTFFIPLIIVIYRFIPKNKSVNKRIYVATIIFFTVLPLLLNYFTTKEFASWFYNRYSISISDFTMTRVDIVNTVKRADLTNYGLGTITNYLEERNVKGQTSMHSDLLRIYMECTFLGVFLYVYNYFKIAKNNYISFIILVYFFFGLAINHLIGAGSITILIEIFMLIMYFNNKYRGQGEKNEK